MFRALDNSKFREFAINVLWVVVVVLPVHVCGQSASQSYPTPIVSTEISGSIQPRDIGDARLTTYYYAFEGSTGDLFINVVTRNFTGDIDLFTFSGLKPLTKIVVYADLAETETGRVVYFRKPEKLLLRIQGRPPGDDPASFRIKFAGSFVAVRESDYPPEPALPKADILGQTDSRNAIGTIREVVKPKADQEVVNGSADANPKAAEPSKGIETAKSAIDPGIAPSKPEVVITDNLEKGVTPPVARKDAAASRVARRTRRSALRTAPEPLEKAFEVDPLSIIRLVIEFKDGKLIERPMNEVLKFSVDKGILTVISKDGRIGRYSILDVGKVTIQ